MKIQPKLRVIHGEPVIVPSGAVMGAEMIDLFAKQNKEGNRG